MVVVKLKKLFIVIGLFLVIEGVLSIMYSQDARQISHIGRIIRILIGIYLTQVKN